MRAAILTSTKKSYCFETTSLGVVILKLVSLMCLVASGTASSEAGSEINPMCFHLARVGNLRNIFFNCKNFDRISCPDNKEYSAEGNCTTPGNVTCTIRTSFYESSGLDDLHTTAHIDCPDCQVTLNSSDWEAVVNQKCIPYVLDQNCPATIDYFYYSDLRWCACHNGTGLGLLTNPRTNANCTVLIASNNRGLMLGKAYCPDCAYFSGWHYDVGYGDEDGFIHFGWWPLDGLGSHDRCMETVNDDSCTIPHFVCEEPKWNVCIKGNGDGFCTRIVMGNPQLCKVSTSSDSSWPCANETNGCGKINCDEYTLLECQAFWNMSEKSEFYESPEGCMPTRNPAPTMNPSGKKGFILPVSLFGGAVFTVIAFAAIVTTVFFCYTRYKRRDYRSF